MAHWAETAIFWHVYPLGFLGAPPSSHGSQDQQTDSGAAEPRLRRLGNWLDYVVELGANGLLLGPVFASETHGYDTVSHYRVDPRLGAEPDLVELFEQATARGIRVVLDGVFNHVARSFPQLADVVERGEDSPYASWFRRRPDGTFNVFEGHERLVTLNHDDPQVVDYVSDVMTYWLDRGAAGWRLDAAYAVPTAFWRQVTDRVRAKHPDAWLLGEVIHGDYTSFVSKSGVDSVTQYELWKATWSSLNDGNFYEVAWALDRHEQLLDTFVPQTFLGNHDVTRIASQLVDARHLAHALVLLFTVAGIPSVYAGDEQGMLGVKEQREGGDDAVRPAFPARPEPLSPQAAATLALHRELIAVRRRHPWLVRARTHVEHLTNTHLLLRVTDGGSELLVALNLGEAETFTLPPMSWHPVAGHGELDGNRLTIEAHGWCLLGPASTRVDQAVEAFEVPTRYRSDEEDSARWVDFPVRDGDVVISTRSKSGTTWMQMICALLVFQTPDLPCPLAELSPWLDWLVAPSSEVYARLAAQQHRRFIKTHTPLDGLPLDERATYIVVARHPLDMAVSLYHQGDNLDRERVRALTGAAAPEEPAARRPPLREWLLAWIEQEAQPVDQLDSLPGVMWHLSDAWVRRADDNVLLVHYDDLVGDLDHEMRRVAARLGITVPAKAWPDLVASATFESMKARAERTAPDASRVLKDRAAFYRRGRSGEGREVLTEDELARYHTRAARLAPPDLLAWLHRG